MELNNTNFDNIKIDLKNNQIYKFIKAKNDFQITKFDFLSKYIFKFSRDINFIPNINVWERKENILIIGMNLIQNAITLEKMYTNNLIDKKLFVRYYTFLNYQVPHQFYEKSLKILPNNFFIYTLLYSNITHNFPSKIRQNILIDNKKKFWFLPFIDGINYTDDVFKLLENNSHKIYDEIVRKIRAKAIKDNFIIRQQKQENSYNKKYNYYNNTIKRLLQKNRDLTQNRIKYSDLRKRLGDKLFNEYFGKK